MRMTLLLLLCMFLQLAPAQNATNLADEQQEKSPAVSIAPTSIDFRDQVVKKPSRPIRVTVTNAGTRDLYINSAVIGGDNREDFVMSRDTCTGATIGAKRSCVVDIVFAPTTNERRRAMLTFTDNALDSPQNIQMDGNGINSVAEPPRKKDGVEK